MLPSQRARAGGQSHGALGRKRRREELGSRAGRNLSGHLLFPGEAERQKLSEVAQQLEQELQRTQESLASLGLQLEAARQGQQESTAEAASLRKELTQQQEIYGQGVQERTGAVPGSGAVGTMSPDSPDALCAPPPQRCRRRWLKWKVGCGNSSQNQRGD